MTTAIYVALATAVSALLYAALTKQKLVEAVLVATVVGLGVAGLLSVLA